VDVTITELDIVIRLCLGFIAGGIIGFERASRRQVAGLRTHILITLGATCLTLLSIWLPQQFQKSADPGRVAAQVVSGIGFLGAGAIIRLGNNIKGLTTAASLWLVAAIGMVIGAGMYIAALTAEALALITLVLLNHVEQKVFPEERTKMLEIHYNHNTEPDTGKALEILNTFGIQSKTMNVDMGNIIGKKTKVNLLITILDSVNISQLVTALKSADDISRVELKERL
jgi:putative Mg2+ transporter-C (MgtC) family protein